MDITNNLKIERKLEVSEQRFRALVQNSSDLLIITDRFGNYLYVSPTIQSILGINENISVGKNAIDSIHNQDKLFVKTQLKRLKTTKQVKIEPFRVMVNNKQFRWLEAVVTDMFDNPTIRGIVVNAKDVTENIEAESKLNESIKRYNTVSKATNDAIYDWNILDDEIIWNHGIQTIFGYKPSSIYKIECWMTRVHPNDTIGVNKKLQTHMNYKISKFMCEYRVICSDGSYKFVLDRGFINYDFNGQPVRMIGAVQNITDRVNYIHTIEKQNEKFREIAWKQSHLVRAPLANILGLVELLINEKANYIVVEECLSHLKSSAEKLDVVLRQIVKDI